MTAILRQAVSYLVADTLEDAFEKGRSVGKEDRADGVIRPVPYLYTERQRRAWIKGYRSAKQDVLRNR